MKIPCLHAVFSYCADLTSPTAKSVPIAVLSLAEVDDSLFATACGRQLDGKVDQLTATMLADVPLMLKQQLDDIFVRLGGKPTPKTLLRAMQDALRNSLHVSEIVDAQDLELEETATLPDFFAAFTKKALDILSDRVQLIDPEAIWPIVRVRRATGRNPVPRSPIGSNVWTVDQRLLSA